MASTIRGAKARALLVVLLRTAWRGDGSIPTLALLAFAAWLECQRSKGGKRMNKYQVNDDLSDVSEIVESMLDSVCSHGHEPDRKTAEIALDATKRAIDRLVDVAGELKIKADEAKEE